MSVNKHHLIIFSFYLTVNSVQSFLSKINKSHHNLLCFKGNLTAIALLILIASTFVLEAALPNYSVPDQLQWEQRPHAYVSDEIVMSVVPPNSQNGITYQFVCTSGNGPTSAWQADTSFSATGLSPETTYTYLAYSRDNLDRQIGLPADPITITTHAISHPIFYSNKNK